MRVIHVGLMKTATSLLQWYVFPELAKNLGISYNDIQREQIKRAIVDKTTIINNLSKYRKQGLISWETLSAHDPEFWEHSIKIVKHIYGFDTTILLTLRDPHSHLRSIYQQTIQQGNICKPAEFFLNEKDYNKIRSNICTFNYFNLSKYKIESLINLYTNNFKNVFVIPFEYINQLSFLKKIYNMDLNTINKYKKIVKSAPRANKSYSNFAVRLTMKRESLLNFMGLMSRRASRSEFLDSTILYKLLDKENNNSKSIGKKIKMRLKDIVQWRNSMHAIVDKIIPYKPYLLPNEILDNQSENQHYYEYLVKQSKEKGYLEFEK